MENQSFAVLPKSFGSPRLEILFFAFLPKELTNDILSLNKLPRSVAMLPEGLGDTWLEILSFAMLPQSLSELRLDVMFVAMLLKSLITNAVWFGTAFLAMLPKNLTTMLSFAMLHKSSSKVTPKMLLLAMLPKSLANKILFLAMLFTSFCNMSTFFCFCFCCSKAHPPLRPEQRPPLRPERQTRAP